MASIPTNPQAERAVLGACLISSEALGEVSEILRPEDFHDVNHREVYKICLKMYQEGQPIDLVTFREEAVSRGIFDRIGGEVLLSELFSDAMMTSNAGYYAKIVQTTGLRRRMIEAGQKISALGTKSDIEAGEIVSEAEKIILEASSEKDTSGPVSLGASMPSVMARIDELRTGTRKNTGFMRNFPDLDRILAGFQPGTLNIIAARPSMGKTALALNIAQFGSTSEANSHVLFFSLEMSSEQLIHRMLSAQTLELGEEVEISAIATGELTEHDAKVLTQASEELGRRNVHIYYSSELTALDFRTKCRRFKTRHPELSLIVVDYLQLMNGGRKNDTRQYEVAEISRMMKSVAVELNCPVIALSQLSRQTENRVDKKPQLSDLRDSGAIEQDADTVILLYREDYYTESEGSGLMDSQADIRVAKNRNGMTGTCKLVFRREYTRFEDYAEAV